MSGCISYVISLHSAPKNVKKGWIALGHQSMLGENKTIFVNHAWKRLTWILITQKRGKEKQIMWNGEHVDFFWIKFQIFDVKYMLHEFKSVRTYYAIGIRFIGILPHRCVRTTGQCSFGMFDLNRFEAINYRPIWVWPRPLEWKKITTVDRP